MRERDARAPVHVHAELSATIQYSCAHERREGTGAVSLDRWSTLAIPIAPVRPPPRSSSQPPTASHESGRGPLLNPRYLSPSA